MADPLLSVFSPPLLARILCGGEGLQAAYGPLIYDEDADDPIVWEPRNHDALSARGVSSVFDQPELWRLPLDHWRARLALVAAWMLWPAYLNTTPAPIAGRIVHVRSDVYQIDAWLDRKPWTISAAWSGPIALGAQYPSPPTLPAHLRDHDPAVALILALYDVPEIREKLS